ncbi:Sodium/pantothenate symporter [Planctomycetes bacterium Pan216]|uniref:Sodium/pantothenate symporter n=1 Tax=Kolteria novifilia TaxID=2527975 RepID=A0A518B5D9_9BACT|nr:Sodium/pantothenate symporter [Planctomycetes bacterium Pan216]
MFHRVLAAQGLANGSVLESKAALVTFLIYSVIVFLLAILANRMQQSRSFLKEYFLGSRGLGTVAISFSFAATAASAGTFAGFPALIYTHGWILALWIASYMAFAICGLGLLGKRLNAVARRTGSITVPEVLRERFNSPMLAVMSTGLMATLLIFYMVPQFKVSAIILQKLIGDVPGFRYSATLVENLTNSVTFLSDVNPEYLLSLLFFSVLVILYTAFGGFRAVVWTDVLQGFVMVGGVLLMLGLTIWQVGGLTAGTTKMAVMTPPKLGEAVIRSIPPAPETGIRVPSDTWVTLESDDKLTRLFRTNQLAIILPEKETSNLIKIVEITTPEEIERVLASFPETAPPTLPVGLSLDIDDEDLREYRYGAGKRGVYVSGPGPSPSSEEGFLTIGLAISFFLIWAISGTAQPANMVRLIAAGGSKTIRRSMAVVAVYFLLIYPPLVVIFCYARVLVPGLDQDPDRIMTEMTFHLSHAAGLPWLAGLLVAAPFAAVMSSVDSFLLMISSSFVRDIYQRNFDPDASDKRVKRLSYACTLLIGSAVMVASIKPPQFLQYLIVFAGGALGVTFLVPMTFALFWRRANRQGALAAMLGGVAVYLMFYLVGFAMYEQAKAWRPGGLDPLFWGLAASLVFGVVVSLLTPPPPAELVSRYFGDAEATSG